MRRMLGLLLLLWSTVSFAQLYFVRDNSGQIYTINTTTGAATSVATVAAITSSTIGATESPNPNVLFASTYTDLVSFNVDGTGATSLGPISGAGIAQTGAEALGFCNTANVLYGLINGNFFTINPATGARIVALAAPGDDVEGLACNHAANVLYGIGRTTGTLYSYAPATNTWTTVGSTGLSPTDPGLAYDPVTAVLYTIDGGTGNIYRINPATAASTLVGPTGLGGVGGGLAFTSAAAPAANVPVPTLGEYALVLLTLLVAGVAFGQFSARSWR